MNTDNKEYEFCLRCGRKLRKPESRRLGLGPSCHKKRIKEYEDGRKLFQSEHKKEEQA